MGGMNSGMHASSVATFHFSHELDAMLFGEMYSLYFNVILHDHNFT